MKVIDWHVFYDDGKEFTSARTDWDSLPRDGVQAVVLYFDEVTKAGAPYRRIMSGHDFYFRADGSRGYIFADSDDPAGEIKKRYPGALILRGKWADEETHYAINFMASEAKEAPSEQPQAKLPAGEVSHPQGGL